VDYGINIRLILEGRQQVKSLQGDIAQLKKQVEEITKLDVKGVFEDPKRIQALQRQRRIGEKIVGNVNEEIESTKESTRQLNNKLLKQIRLNAAVSLFERQLQATLRTGVRDQKQFVGQIEQIEEAFKFFKKGEDLAGIQALGTELGRINEYQRETDRLALGRLKTSEKSREFLAEINNLRAQGVNTLKAEKTLEKFNVTAGTNKFERGKQYEIILNRRLKLLRAELALQRQQAQAEQQRISARNQRIGGAVSSGLIGGGFPLLFGQGGGAAAGGALGGVAGGLIGGPFGFALSIVGTALGQAFDESQKFNDSLVRLNVGLDKTGSTSITTGQDIRRLAEELNLAKEEAIELVGSFSAIGDAAGREELARAFGPIGGVETFEAVAKAALSEKDALEAISSLRNTIGNETYENLVDVLKTKGAQAAQVALLAALLDTSEKITKDTETRVGFMDRITAAFMTQAAIRAGAPEMMTTPEEIAAGRTPEPLSEQLINKFIDIRKRLLKDERTLRDEIKDRSSTSAADEARRTAQLQHQRDALSTNLFIQRDIFQEQLNGNEIAVIRLTQAQKLNDIAKRARDIEVSKLTPAQQKIELDRLELERYRARLQAAFDILTIERQINQTRQDALGGSNERINLLAAQINGTEQEYLLTQRIRELEAAGVENAVDQATAEFKLLEVKNAQIFAQEQLNQLVNTTGQQFAGLIENLINGTNSWNDSLRNVFRTLSSALFRTGLKLLGGGDGRGFFSILSGDFTGKALGGQVSAGTPYMVGERGPEMFVPGANGNIVPNNAMGGVQVGSINITVENTGEQLSPAAQKQIANQVQGIVMSTLVNERRSGGLLR